MEKKYTKEYIKVEASQVYSNELHVYPSPTFEENDYNAQLFSQAPKLVEALELLLQLHSCEQEGLSSGMPTPQQWIDALCFAQQALENALK